MEKEEYVKPTIESKEIEIGVYGGGCYCAGMTTNPCDP